MSIYWSDPDGNHPPDHCTFQLRTFSSKSLHPIKNQIRTLPSPKSYTPIKKTLLPDFPAWKTNIEKALQSIEKKWIQKVVLARATILEFDCDLDPWAITAALKERQKGAYLFCAEINQGHFLGMSPEKLFSKKNGKIQSMALAGTRKRGHTLSQDSQLENELLHSAKDLREFNPVKAYIQKALSPFCISPFEWEPTQVYKTYNVQHLFSQIEAPLETSIEDERIIEALHPTPALCGEPKLAAKALIDEIEPFDRGLYGGCIGWTTDVASEWIVGIRSCLVQKNRAILYTGTGIVEGSDPEKEWEELNQKGKMYDGILDYRSTQCVGC